ncbi:inhibin beta B chain [Clonorchis sinensis]|uniref:Inhibin beta B chain n=2 Tax=Clonorchis sinensis TaxID=79923 RepID=G7YP06_CLOSI|nr:inhibin beta B chain [Clonorchis sinensis]
MCVTLCSAQTTLTINPTSASSSACWTHKRGHYSRISFGIASWMRIVLIRTLLSLVVNAFIQTELRCLRNYSTIIMTSALIVRPRFSGPAPYYFQAPNNKQITFQERNSGLHRELFSPWESETNSTSSMEETPTESETNVPQERILPEAELLPPQPCPSSILGLSGEQCGNSVMADNTISDEKYTHEDEKIIALFQQRMLKQLNLKEPPKVTNSSWSSIPRFLQRQLQHTIEGHNHILEDPVEQNEEKEVLVLLQPHPFQLRKIPSLAFTVKLVDYIDDRHILRARIHAEAFRELPYGSEISLWEIVRPWPGSHTRHSKLQSYGPWDETYVFLPSSGAQPSEDTYPIPGERGVMSFEDISVVGQKVASALVYLDESDKVTSVTFNITSRLVHWIKQRNRMVLNGRDKINHRPLVKHLLLICPTCADSQIPLDPRKVVMDIRYRAGLKRTKRAAGGSEEGLSNMCQEVGHQFTCCTQPLSIKFSEIGWNKWIVFPKQVEPNYCRGSCQATGSRSSHYDILNLLHQKNSTRFPGVRRDELQSCCYPTRRNSFSILYMAGENDIRMHVLHNLIVLGCGCS